jgi:hypothetical protein
MTLTEAQVWARAFRALPTTESRIRGTGDYFVVEVREQKEKYPDDWVRVDQVTLWSGEAELVDHTFADSEDWVEVDV